MSYNQSTFFINFIFFFVIKEFDLLRNKWLTFISSYSYIILFSIEFYNNS